MAKSKLPQVTDWRSPIHNNSLFYWKSAPELQHCAPVLCILTVWKTIQASKLLINRQSLSCYRKDIFLSIYLTEKITFPHRNQKPFPFYEITFHWAIGPGAENVIKRELQYRTEQWTLLSSGERQTDSSLLYADTVNKTSTVIIHSYFQSSISNQEDSMWAFVFEGSGCSDHLCLLLSGTVRTFIVLLNISLFQSFMSSSTVFLWSTEWQQLPPQKNNDSQFQ